MTQPLTLTPERCLGTLKAESTTAPIKNATWYTAQTPGDGLAYTFPIGALANAHYLVADMLLAGTHLVSLTLYLQEGANGPRFGLNFGLLNQVSARMRAPLEAVNQNRWRYPREGAWLKPRCRDQRVDLRKVDRMTIEVEHKSDQPVHFCITPITATAEEPPKLDKLVLPVGPLLDEFGQSTLHDWPTKSGSALDVAAELATQLAAVPTQAWPAAYSQWGGWTEKPFASTGFFHTHNDGNRWWLVDPEGYAFWSSGLDCVRFGIDAAYTGLEDALTWLPDKDSDYAQAYSHHREGEAFDYLKANFIRSFSPDGAFEKWAKITLSQMRAFGFNTVANWSDWAIAKAAGFPYVRPLNGNALDLPKIYRDFPDVFHPNYEQVKAQFADQLRDTVDDPAFIGYFLMNEPSWGFAQETPAAGMLFNTPECYSRIALADFLKERYSNDVALTSAWGINTTFAEIAAGLWDTPLTPSAQKDLADFSEVLVTRFFGGLSEACRKVDPHHLNLGIRYYTVPPEWCLPGMQSFDVFSMNCYKQKLPAEQMAHIAQLLDMPIMIGEWHFGALDVGLPASGIGHVPTQEDRGKAFRIYVEDAAAKPWCVGVHYFTLYDQSAIGRFDGENYNIGFLDVCNRPYAPLAAAARASHEQLYKVATGQVPPYDDAPEYLPLLFL